jgi:hypothetical protein
VVAEELGTTTDKVRQLIKGEEILATGKPAHEYVSREELAAACETGLMELLRRLGQEVPQIFEESLEYLRRGHMGLAERACWRLVARESMVGSFALPYEMAFHLARGERDEVEARLGFIRKAEDAARARLMRNLRRALRGMSFEDEAARATAERLLGGDETSKSDGPVIGSKPDELQRLAMFITTAIFNEVDRRRKKFIRPGRKDEVSEIIRSAVYSSLYAHESCERLASSREFIDAIGVLMPRYYRPAGLVSNLVREQETDDNNVIEG